MTSCVHKSKTQSKFFNTGGTNRSTNNIRHLTFYFSYVMDEKMCRNLFMKLIKTKRLGLHCL